MVLDDPAMVGRGTYRPRLMIHVPGNMLESHGQQGFGLYGRIAPDLRRMGIEVEFLARPRTTELATYTKEDFHLVHHGFLRRFNLLNCGIAYIWPFWSIDQRGVLCDSSIINARPQLDSIDPERARRFVEGLHARTAGRGISKYDQPELGRERGHGGIVIFLQGLSDPVLRSMYMLETEMLDLVVRYREGRDVLIKPHPKFPDTIATAHATMLAEQHKGVRVLDANIHDLLAGAHCSVSICSGASFEGLLHRTPAILFGRSDFAACAWTVKTEEEAEKALRGIGDRPFDYERFLFWFLRKKMFSQRNPNLAGRVLQRIQRTGFEMLPEGVVSENVLARVAEPARNQGQRPPHDRQTAPGAGDMER